MQHSPTTRRFALTELGLSLDPDVLRGIDPVPTPLPLTRGVEDAFLSRYHRLDPGARTVLLVAAADDSGDLGLVRDAAIALGAACSSPEIAQDLPPHLFDNLEQGRFGKPYLIQIDRKLMEKAGRAGTSA